MRQTMLKFINKVLGATIVSMTSTLIGCEGPLVKYGPPPVEPQDTASTIRVLYGPPTQATWTTDESLTDETPSEQ